MPAERVLVTGGTGLVGAWTVRALGERAVAPGREALDVRSLPAVERALEGCGALLHFAGQSVVGAARRDPVATFEANVAGAWTVLEACRRAGARAVLASSDRVHGARSGALREDDPVAPTEPYGASKAAAELVALSFGATVTRMSHVFGSGDRQRSRLVPELVAARREGRAALIHSDGSPAYDFLHAADAAAAHLALLDAEAEGIFNVGAGEARSVRELVELAGVEAAYGTERGSEPAWLDTAKLRAATGWTPRISLRDGLAEALGG